jgi:hypothetical protein
MHFYHRYPSRNVLRYFIHSLTSHLDYRTYLFTGYQETMSAMKLLPLGVWRTRDGNWERLTGFGSLVSGCFETDVKAPDGILGWQSTRGRSSFHQWDGKNTAELGKFTHCIVDANGVCWSSRWIPLQHVAREWSIQRISQDCDSWGLQRCEYLAGQ